MKSLSEIISAISLSISLSEIVTVWVGDLKRSYAQVFWATDECDSAVLADGSFDVWGSLDGEDFRLRLVPPVPPPSGRSSGATGAFGGAG